MMVVDMLELIIVELREDSGAELELVDSRVNVVRPVIPSFADAVDELSIPVVVVDGIRADSEVDVMP